MTKTNYVIKQAEQLSIRQIKTILTHWEVPEWRNMSSEKFRAIFSQSEFHLLTESDLKLLCVARINFSFKIKIGFSVFNVAELVGLVSIERGKGYGKKLLCHMRQNLSGRNIEAIGFCEKKVRPFYKKSGIPLLQNKAKYLFEIAGDKKVVSDDDDIINLNLGNNTLKLIKNLSKKNEGQLLLE